MPSTNSIVYVVDDDAGTRKSLCWLIESVGLKVEAYASGSEFLKACDTDRPSCLVLDVRMPEISGLEIQQRLTTGKIDIPVILISGYADVSTAVRAMKSGATDFLEKPFNDQELLDGIQQCIAEDKKKRQRQAAIEEHRNRFMALTPREHEVMKFVATGKSSKAIAQELGASPKTIEVHRARIMRKLGITSLAELICLATETTTLD